jgi:CRISPR-associated protein (TIGR03984 family)
MAASEGEIKSMTSATERLDLSGQMDALAWLAGLMAAEGSPVSGLHYLLATMVSEVVWGKYDGGWQLSNGQPALPADALLELRAFGPTAEVFLWRDASGLRGRQRVDGQGGKTFDTFEETQLLWGTEPDPDRPPRDGFFPLRDGDQGLRHAPPLALDESYFVRPAGEGEEQDAHYGHRPARLRLRHYIQRDDGDEPSRSKQTDSEGTASQKPNKGTGLARIVDSRLVAVHSARPGEKE